MSFNFPAWAAARLVLLPDVGRGLARVLEADADTKLGPGTPGRRGAALSLRRNFVLGLDFGGCQPEINTGIIRWALIECCGAAADQSTLASVSVFGIPTL